MNRLVLIGGLLAFFGLITLYAFEIQHFNLLLDRGRFFTYAAGFGLLLAVLLFGLLYRRTQPGLDRVRLGLGLGFICLFLSPMLVSLTNRLIRPEPPRTVIVDYVDQDARYGSRFGAVEGEQVEATSWFSFFYWNDRLYRISTPAPLFGDLQEGQRAPLRLQRGLWQLDRVVLPAADR